MSDYGPLFVAPRASERFGKEARKRAATQLNAVRDLMGDGAWRGLKSIQSRLREIGIHATEASISARLRDLRKQEHGAHEVLKSEWRSGLYEYRVGPPGSEPVSKAACCPTCGRKTRGAR